MHGPSSDKYLSNTTASRHRLTLRNEEKNSCNLTSSPFKDLFPCLSTGFTIFLLVTKAILERKDSVSATVQILLRKDQKRMVKRPSLLVPLQFNVLCSGDLSGVKTL